jgi:hypothetical protein
LFSRKWLRTLTAAAATDAGYTLNDALALAQRVCDVDKGTQSDSPQDTHQQATGDRKENGYYENCWQAYDGAEGLLRRLMQENKLAEALHLIQDQWGRLIDISRGPVCGSKCYTISRRSSTLLL